MPQEALIFDATESNFNEGVIDNSHKLPVVVEFMGSWSEPCFVMDHIYSTLAREFAGEFVFARVDIDEQPELRKRFQIEHVPTVMVIRHGEVARMDMGEMTDDEARQVLSEQGVTHESDEMRMEARAKHMAGDTQAAVMLLTQAIQKDSGNPRVAMDMVQIFIDMGEIDQASALLGRLPQQVQESEQGKYLKGQLAFASYASHAEPLESLLAKLESDPADHKSRFDLAISLVAMHDSQQAMEQLLTILEQEPEYDNGAAREMLVVLIRMLKDNNPDLAADAQRRMSNLLAK